MNRLGGTHHYQYGTTDIEYELVYTNRTTLKLEVYPDLSVVVYAPLDTPLEAIEGGVAKRAPWIAKQQRKFREAPIESPLPRRYVSGEAYRFLGHQYRLKVLEDRVERVLLDGSYIAVYTPKTGDKRRVAALLDSWYRRQAERVFSERLDACFARVESLGIPRPEIVVKDMKTRWGSCTPAGRLSLNPKLVNLPLELIDYVLLHELCHLKEMNHSPAFFKLLERILPDWQQRRNRLNRAETS
ncbi:MAG: M48 family metallopeptidase [Chloroflexi bacterium]|uniref:M48 family metallopeptidase n=1 Tax=Candidatus Flexifilum breve TaxID=3140694 RepID=UPI003134B164|nr:M48 family metallopeptidase [Chloroflexota bacterium]